MTSTDTYSRFLMTHNCCFVHGRSYTSGHKYPKDNGRCKARIRSEPDRKLWKPTANNVVCKAHFTMTHDKGKTLTISAVLHTVKKVCQKQSFYLIELFNLCMSMFSVWRMVSGDTAYGTNCRHSCARSAPTHGGCGGSNEGGC